MKRLFSIGLILNWKSLLIAIFAIGSTWACLRFEITGEFEMTLISTAVIFPIVFSIGQAYTRREDALSEYGNLKAHGRALYFAARDWMPQANEARLNEIRGAMIELLSACRDLFKHDRKDMEIYEARVYAAFSNLSVFARNMRDDGLASGECSRLNQYISKMVISFENVKHIYQYRTPRTLRAFSNFFIILLPILYGPYFAFKATEFSPALTYVMPVLFAIILVGLDNIQTHLEDPFDQIGEDDVMINAEKFIALLSCGESPSKAKA